MPLKYFLMTIFLVGCSSIKDIKRSDGKIVSEIKCDYMDECFEKASDHCRNFQVINSAQRDDSFELVVQCERKS